VSCSVDHKEHARIGRFQERGWWPGHSPVAVVQQQMATIQSRYGSETSSIPPNYLCLHLLHTFSWFPFFFIQPSLLISLSLSPYAAPTLPYARPSVTFPPDASALTLTRRSHGQAPLQIHIPCPLQVAPDVIPLSAGFKLTNRSNLLVGQEPCFEAALMLLAGSVPHY
jgi:hypothetical protein